MNPDDSKLYVVEALWDTGWKYDDFAISGLRDFARYSWRAGPDN